MATTDRSPVRPAVLPGCTVLPPLEPAGELQKAKADENDFVSSASKKGKRKAGAGRSERFSLLNTFADVALSGLTGAETKVWLILFRDVKAATDTARTGQADIARRAGLSVRGVRYALAGLEAKGLLTVLRRGRLNVGPSVYRVGSTPTVV